MTIAYVSSAAAASDSLAMPSHQTGDLLVMFAASVTISPTSVPTVPAGWIRRAAVSTSSGRSFSVGWKTAASNGEASGTWTGATHLACAVYRSSKRMAVGGLSSALSGAGGSTLISYQLISDLIRAGDCWIIGGCASHIDGAADTAPSGMTNRVSVFSGGEIALHDTNGPVASWSLVSVATASTIWRSMSLEIFETDVDVAGGSGGFPLSRVLN